MPASAGLTIAYSLLVVCAIFVPLVLGFAMFAVWWERKVAGHIQSRIGPNRVGPIGLLQSLADGIKLITKEDLTPHEADRWLFKLAPYLAFAPVFTSFCALPFGPDLIFEPRLSIGLFWVLSILSVEVMGVILAGWASNNKWSVYGAMREACQIVSYEIPLGMSVLVVVMSAGTLNLLDIGLLQGGGLQSWLIFRNPFALLAYVIFFIASLAANKRAPFDLPESDSELVAGYHTEYSGMRFGFFFFADYAAMFVTGAIGAVLFLGAWNDPFGYIGWAVVHYSPSHQPGPLLLVNLLAAALLVGKTLAAVFVQMWLRWTLPRPRIDQVLYVCVQVLLPGACVLLFGAGLWRLFIPEIVGVPWRDYQPFDLDSYQQQHAIVSVVGQTLLALAGVGVLGAVILWVLRAIADGRSVVKRLNEPDPILTAGPA